MRKIRLLELRLSNIFYYGNNINVFKFKKGLTWIKGVSGVGKSTIIEALCYVLFGEAYNKNIKLEHLINSINKKGLIIELDFEIVENDKVTSYTIRRGMSPKLFVIIINKEDGTKLQVNKEAGFSQKTFEDEVLGFDIILFRNVISLNSLATKPFLSMAPEDKRKLIESIITLDISKYKKKISTDQTSANVRLSTSTSDVRSYTNKILELEAILLKLETEKESGIIELQEQLSKIESSLNQCLESEKVKRFEHEKIMNLGKEAITKYEKYKNIDTKISNIQQVINISEELVNIRENFAKKTENLMDQVKSIEKLTKQKEKSNKKLLEETPKLDKYKDLPEKIKDQNNTIFYSKKEMEKIKKVVEDFKSGIVVGVACVTCGKVSSEEDKETHIKKHREDYKTHKKTHDDAVIELDKLNKVKSEFDLAKEKLNEITSEVSKIEQSIQSETKVKNSLDSDIASIAKQIESKKTYADTLIPEFNIDKDSKDILTNKLEEYNKDKIFGDELNSEITKLREVVSTAKIELATIETTINNHKKDVKEINEKINKKKEESKEDSIGITKKQIVDSKKELVSAQELMGKSSDDIQILDFMSVMFGEEGIKKTVIGTFVPVLNKAIEKNLRVFGLPFSIEFTDSLNYIFHNGYGSAMVYDALSNGQKQKLHFSISMAFRDFVSMVGDFNINILFLDEILDISVDPFGVEQIVEILKTKVESVEGIYLMTHHLGDTFYHEWNHVVEIVYDGKFSEIVEVS